MIPLLPTTLSGNEPLIGGFVILLVWLLKTLSENEASIRACVVPLLTKTTLSENEALHGGICDSMAPESAVGK